MTRLLALDRLHGSLVDLLNVKVREVSAELLVDVIVDGTQSQQGRVD
jgi:hypothetical protein